MHLTSIQQDTLSSIKVELLLGFLTCVHPAIGNTITHYCDAKSGKLPCPCGDQHHAHYNYQKIYNLCWFSKSHLDPDAYSDDDPLCSDSPN